MERWKVCVPQRCWPSIAAGLPTHERCLVPACAQTTQKRKGDRTASVTVLNAIREGLYKHLVGKRLTKRLLVEIDVRIACYLARTRFRGWFEASEVLVRLGEKRKRIFDAVRVSVHELVGYVYARPFALGELVGAVGQVPRCCPLTRCAQDRARASW
jgi:predicted ATP-dependent protease